MFRLLILFPSWLLAALVGMVLIIFALSLLNLFLWRQKRKELRAIQRMLLRAEETAHKLSYLPYRETTTDTRDVFATLKSLNRLLDQVLANQNTPAQETQQTESVQQPPPILKQADQAQPSATAKELIRLRDLILMARPEDGEATMSPEVLDLLYQNLGGALLHEGITPLEKTDSPFNRERQQVVDTEVTHDPAQHGLVCRTERPGYLFHEKLIRPQLVVVYKFQDPVQPRRS